MSTYFCNTRVLSSIFHIACILPVIVQITNNLFLSALLRFWRSFGHSNVAVWCWFFFFLTLNWTSKVVQVCCERVVIGWSIPEHFTYFLLLPSCAQNCYEDIRKTPNFANQLLLLLFHWLQEVLVKWSTIQFERYLRLLLHEDYYFQ